MRQKRHSRFDRRSVVLMLGGASLLAAETFDITSARAKTSPDCEKPKPIVNVKSHHGACGDGKTDDTCAFQSACAALTKGGTLLIPPGTYLVGKQAGLPTKPGKQVYQPEPIIKFKGVKRPVLIEGVPHPGSGKKPILRANDGLHFGSFYPTGDSAGRRYDPPGAFYDLSYRADAYVGIIELDSNQSVHIRNLELDGNQQNLTLGGIWGDTGRQCAAAGIHCDSNANVSISNVHTHDHGLDGITIENSKGSFTERQPHTLQSVDATRNGRNNLSWVGCSGLTVTNSTFDDAGRGRVHSSPGAGVDIEPENTHMTVGRFTSCSFRGNVGCGISADQADPRLASVSDVTFTDCKVVGTGYYSLIVRNPQFTFQKCDFVGSMLTNPSDSLPRGSIQFDNCSISDNDPAAYRTGYLVDAFYGGSSVTFQNTSFTASKQRFGAFSGCTITDCKFYVNLPGGFFALTDSSADWIVTLYHSWVLNCVFIDHYPNPPPKLSINYGGNPVWSNNTISPTNSRLYFANEG